MSSDTKDGRDPSDTAKSPKDAMEHYRQSNPHTPPPPKQTDGE
ncbi:hypothetical protein [Paraburkholderia terrae]|nr:hypothetical protein [Paraburkholderia terrae]GJH02269.1 hypothetical protein CBA19C8_16950 [Paraburkholderia terrae]